MRVELDKMHVDNLKDLRRDLQYEKDRLEYDLSFIEDDILAIEEELERREELDS